MVALPMIFIPSMTRTQNCLPNRIFLLPESTLNTEHYDACFWGRESNLPKLTEVIVIVNNPEVNINIFKFYRNTSKNLSFKTITDNRVFAYYTGSIAGSDRELAGLSNWTNPVAVEKIQTKVVNQATDQQTNFTISSMPTLALAERLKGKENRHIICRQTDENKNQAEETVFDTELPNTTNFSRVWFVLPHTKIYISVSKCVYKDCERLLVFELI